MPHRALLLAIPLAAIAVGCSDDPQPATAGADSADATEPLGDRQHWSGAQVYDEVCDRCHKMGVDGAPQLGDAEDWRRRIGKGREPLFDHVLHGFNKMPARGDCGFCSDAQLRSAMQYMIANSGAGPAR